MKRIRSAGVVWPYGITAFSLFLLGLAADCGAQIQRAAPAAPAFEVVSFKYAGTPMDRARVQNGVVTITRRPLKYEGGRLTGEATVWGIIEFACSPLLTPYRQEPDGRGLPVEYYQIDAMAPAGTTLDEARAMLRKVLAERIGFRFHIVDRRTPIYNLMQDGGTIKLMPSIEAQPAYSRYPRLFRTKSATIADFAAFLSSVVGSDVIDTTGIQGRYQFDLDWRNELQEADARSSALAVALAEVKRLGLKLEGATETRKILVVDHLDDRPTPN